jgi:hypothetical protein
MLFLMSTISGGPIYRQTGYDDGTMAVFVYLGAELIAAAVEHRRPAHERYKGASFWHIVTVLDIPGVDPDALRALEARDESTARAWLGFIAGLAELATSTDVYALRGGPRLTMVALPAVAS